MEKIERQYLIGSAAAIVAILCMIAGVQGWISNLLILWIVGGLSGLVLISIIIIRFINYKRTHFL